MRVLDIVSSGLKQIHRIGNEFYWSEKMNFFKFHQNEKPVLVNLDNATEIYSRTAAIGCNIYFAAGAGNKDNQVTISVDETLDQIYALIKRNMYSKDQTDCESQRTENNQEPDRSIVAPLALY